VITRAQVSHVSMAADVSLTTTVIVVVVDSALPAITANTVCSHSSRLSFPLCAASDEVA